MASRTSVVRATAGASMYATNGRAARSARAFAGTWTTRLVGAPTAPHGRASYGTWRTLLSTVCVCIAPTDSSAAPSAGTSTVWMITDTYSAFGANAISCSSGATLFIRSSGASPSDVTESSARDTMGLPVGAPADGAATMDGSADADAATRNAAAIIAQTVSTASALLTRAFGILISPPIGK